MWSIKQKVKGGRGNSKVLRTFSSSMFHSLEQKAEVGSLGSTFERFPQCDKLPSSTIHSSRKKAKGHNVGSGGQKVGFSAKCLSGTGSGFVYV